MKASELRPCDNCGGHIGPTFYTVDVSLALIDPRSVRNFQALMTSHGSMQLAEIFNPFPDMGVRAADEHPELETRLILCSECAFKDVVLQSVMAKVQEDEERKKQRQTKQTEEEEPEIADQP